jgi:long-chain acyl-CoA synthetase
LDLLEVRADMRGLVNLGDLRDGASPEAHPALIDCRLWDSPSELSHGELDKQVDACARALAARGLARGDRVAIFSLNRAEYLIAYFAVMRAGFVAVPVNIKFPRETLSFILEDAEIRLCFCDKAGRELLPAGIPAIDFDDPGPKGFANFLDVGPFETVAPRRGETAMVLYTSGSTGRPKGVPLSHDGQLWALRTRLVGGRQDRHRLLVAAPLFHMNALGMAKLSVAAGASLVLMPQFNARRYIEAIGRFKVTWLTSVPTMLALALRERETLAGTDLSSVESIRMASAPITQTLIDQVRQTFPMATLSIGYGTTEAGPAMFGPRPGLTKADLALGWPVPGVEVRLVGPDGEATTQGELWIRTPANMAGYLNLPEKTRQVLTADGWYKSGDIFRCDETGAYTFVGRVDDMFVCGGENIYPGEVESMLERHRDIVQACVVPVPDELKGEKPFAFIVLRPGASLSEHDVKRFALDNAPAYQHPRAVMFTRELPLATTNKVDRRALGLIARERWSAMQSATAIKASAKDKRCEQRSFTSTAARVRSDMSRAFPIPGPRAARCSCASRWRR